MDHKQSFGDRQKAIGDLETKMSQELQIGHFEQMQMMHQFLFDLILYIPFNNFSFMSGWVFLG